MKKELAFNVPFSVFAGTTFLNCFTSAYLFNENIPGAEQEKYFFLFGTMCGHTSLRFTYDGAPTEMEKLLCVKDFYDCGGDYAVEFLFGFAGYDYRKLTGADHFKDEIRASVDAGRPVIAAVIGGANQYRVVTGYDGDALISPIYTGAQNPPAGPPAYGDIQTLYVFGEKIPPRYGLADGLKRVRQVMEYNINEKLWDTYLDKFSSYHPSSDSFINAVADEKKARMKRLQQSMWDVMNVHNFGEVFRHCYHDELRDPAFDSQRAKIGGPCCGYTHDLSAALITLADQADFSHYYACFYGEMIELTLKQIARNDEAALEAVEEMIKILG